MNSVTVHEGIQTPPWDRGHKEGGGCWITTGVVIRITHNHYELWTKPTALLHTHFNKACLERHPWIGWSLCAHTLLGLSVSSIKGFVAAT